MSDNKKTATATNAYQSKDLDEVRQRIDALDDRIHDTLMERAELVSKVSEAKRKANIQIIQPAREARMIRRLLNRHSGVLPQMAVVRIWRELVGAVSLLQTGLKVAVSVPENDHEYWDLARDYFGSSLPMNRVTSPMSAISAVKDNKVTFAVVPWPSETEEQPWWTYLGPNSPEEMSIIISLPHGEDPENPKPDCRALVVSKAGFDASGEDRSFLLIQCEAENSRAGLVDIAKKAGLTARSISSKRNTSPSVPSLHLMEVDDFVGKNDKRVKEFIRLLEDPGANIVCVGGYPVPPVYSRTVKSPAAESKKVSA